MKRSLLLITLLLFFGNPISAQDMDSLLSDYKNPTSKTRLQSANSICKILYKEGLNDTLITFTNKTDKRFMDAFIYGISGDWLITKSRYKETIYLSAASAKFYEELGDKSSAANSYSTLCVAYQRVGNLEKAIYYGRKCYDIDIQSGDKENMSNSLNNLATLCLYDHKVKEAEQYILKALKIEQTLKHGKTWAIRLGTASEIYTALGQYEKAIKFASQAYEMDEREGREANSAKRLSQLAYAYYSNGDTSKARLYYQKAIPILEKFDIKTSLTICYNQLGMLEMNSGNIAQSKEYLSKAIKYASETGNDVQLGKAYESISQLLEKTSPAEAYDYLKKAFAIQQRIFNEKSEMQIDNFNTKYQAAERKAEIANQQVIIFRHKLILYILIGILTICIAFLVSYSFVNHVLRKRNVALAKSNATRDKLFSLISHDLKNPVIAQKKMLKAIIDNYDSLSAEKVHQLCNELYSSSESLNELLYNLLNWSRLEMGRMNVNPINFSLKDAIQKVTKTLDMQLKEKSLTTTTSIPDDAITFGDINMITIVVRNLIDNAIKFSNRGGEISISAVENDNFWNVSVSDQGIGMSEKVIHSLFKLSQQKSTPGTEGEQGTGLGLIICHEMLTRNGCTIQAINNDDKGARFIFTIKKANYGNRENQDYNC